MFKGSQLRFGDDTRIHILGFQMLPQTSFDMKLKLPNQNNKQCEFKKFLFLLILSRQQNEILSYYKYLKPLK